VFVLIPLSTAEESLVYKESDLVGRTGVVITPIPLDGYGEVMIESLSGRIAKTALSFDKKEIQNGTRVLVVEVENGILQVVVYDKMQEFI
jgi:membrane protein implicated in regulation of membrane protease activity